MQKTRGIDEQGIGTTSGAVKEHQHAQLLIPFEHNQHKGPRIRCGSHQWLPGIKQARQSFLWGKTISLYFKAKGNMVRTFASTPDTRPAADMHSWQGSRIEW